MTPQLRFPEFTDEWQVKKLGDYYKLQGGYAFESVQYKKHGIPIIRISNISNVHNFIDKSNLTYHEKIPKDDQFTIKDGNLLVAMSGATTGKASVYNLGVNGYLNQRVGLFREISKSSYGFLVQFVFSSRFDNQLDRVLVAGAQPNISSKDIENFQWVVPSKPEQEKIADFLTAVDERIGVSEKKLELLETYKRGVMQKIFTRAVRFKDENGNPYPDWEEKKLGEISKIKTGDSDVQDAVADGEYPFFIRSKEVKRSNKYIYDGEAILIPGEGGIGEIFHYIVGKFNYHQRVYKISDFDTGTHGKYILYFIHQNFARQANKHSVKATVDSLRLPTFTGFDISLPCLAEQQKIADFLTTLDARITAEKSKLTATRQFKKVLLQRMFV